MLRTIDVGNRSLGPCLLARPSAAPPSPALSPAGPIPSYLKTKKTPLWESFLSAGSEGIGPPLEVLETPGLPLTYEPNGTYCTKF